MNSQKHIRIAIDGPAAAGKSTVAKRLAKLLSFVYIDTGAMYRALTLKVLREQININDEVAVIALLHKTTISLTNVNGEQAVFLDDEDVTERIRENDVSNAVSYIAKLPSVREEMVRRQRLLAENVSVIMDGRDIGTNVLPNAEVKIFLLASVEERAKRRYEENKRKGIASDLAVLKKEIAERDKHDMEREHSPLKRADDAMEIDTTSLAIDDVVVKILAHVNNLSTT